MGLAEAAAGMSAGAHPVEQHRSKRQDSDRQPLFDPGPAWPQRGMAEAREPDEIEDPHLERGAILTEEDRTQRQQPVLSAQRFIAGLHLIQFRHWTLRWVYFVLGLTGCALIATGYLFWLESRKKRDGRLGPRGVRLVEALTVGSVSGILVATLAFFVANRLLPLGTVFLGEDRASLEMWAFYLVWLASFTHAALRPRRSWIEQCGAIAVLALAAVLLNWTTTGDHPGRSLGQPHLWSVAGMDILLLGSAATAASTAFALGRRRARATSLGLAR